MTALAELLRLMQARDDARKAWLSKKDDDALFGANLDAVLALREFINKTTAAEVGAATLFWDAREWDCTHDDLQDLFDGYDDNEIIDVGAAVRLPNFFLVKHWPEEADERQWLTAPTREELERKIREAGDA